MQFELDDDQLRLQETVRGVLAKECTAAFVRSVIDEGADPSSWWRTMVDLYWPALAIEESAGGLGMTWVELAILLEELGRAVDPSPYLATTTQFVPVVRHCGTADQASRWLAAVAEGSITGAMARGEASMTATPVEGEWRLDGYADHVVDADRADEIAVVAGVPAEQGSIGVFVVDRGQVSELAGTAAAGWAPTERFAAESGAGPLAGAPSVEPSGDGAPGAGGHSAIAFAVEPIPAFDHTAHIGRLTLSGVVVASDRRLTGTDVAAGVDAAVEEATLGWAVTTVGACQRILDLALDYVKQRHQFGVPIGSFQAVKHKAVDMYVAIERARAITQYAALTIAEGDERRSIAVSMAKAAAGECQEVVFQHGFQLFGGMGFTWENDLQMALRRAKLGAMMFGSTGEHRRRVALVALAPGSRFGSEVRVG